MPAKSGDEEARQLGEQMAERVLSGAARRDRSTRTDIDKMVSITSTQTVPPALARYANLRSPRSDIRLDELSDLPLLSAVTRRTAGTLVAEGDSWFDYPFYDVLTELEDEYGYEIQSAAHRGDTLESMAYSEAQIEGLCRILDKELRKGGLIRGVLLSAGGNDLAGAEFGVLLNHVAAGAPHISESVIKGVVDERCRHALLHMLAWIKRVFDRYRAPNVPIFIHGYDYPVPDGRGYLGGFGPLPGPWLAPGFRVKGFEDDSLKLGIMREIIDRYNEMLASATTRNSFAHVHYVDMRGTLSTGVDYTALWDNELHPSPKGFRRIASRFAEAIAQEAANPPSTGV